MIETLLRQGDQFLRPGGQAPRDGAQADAAIFQQPRPGAVQAPLQIGDERAQVGQHRRGHLGRPGGGRRAAVGDEVDQGGVGLVPHGRDDRDGRRRHRAGQALVVEAPQVLDRAAAARDDQQVGAGDGPVRPSGRRSRGWRFPTWPQAASPWTTTGQTMTRQGQRSAMRCRMSRITAPVGLVITPMVRG